MKSISLNYVCLIFTFQKADGNASCFYKYPRADEIQTRSNPHKSRVSLPPNSKQTLQSECNSKTQFYKFEQELSKHPEFESEPTETKPQVNGSEPWQILQLKRQTLQLMMRQSAAWR